MRFPALFSLLASSLITSAFAERIQVNGIAAKANGEIITQNELMIKLAPMQSVLMARFPARGTNNDRGPQYRQSLEQLRGDLLDELIDRAIIFSQFKDRLVAIPDHVVEDEIEKIIRNAYAGDRNLFNKYLKATNLSFHQFKEQQRKELLVSVIKSQKFGDPPPPTNAEMRKVYQDWGKKNRDRAKDVATYQKIYLLKQDRFDPSITPDGQLALAEDLVKQLKGGADFSELAKKHSRDSMAEQGGMWKNVPRTDLNPEFGFMVFDFEEAEGIVGPLEDRNGFTIFKVVSRQYGPYPSFPEVKERMKKIVNDQKKNDKFQTWMQKQRDRVPVQKMR